MRPIDGVMSPRVDGVISPRVDGREGAPADRAVATEFEAMMLRGMVEAMHRSARIADEEAGGQLVDHLIVDALADNLAKAGGIGLAEMVAGAGDEPHVVPSTEGQLRLERWVKQGAVEDGADAGERWSPPGDNVADPI